MLGMVLGVASLITVLSVMNGFSGELRQRILTLVPHGTVTAEQGQLMQWEPLAAQLAAQEGVIAVAPYISEKAILASDRLLRGAQLTAIDPARSQAIVDLNEVLVAGDAMALEQTPFSVALGVSLARLLGVRPGDTVEVTVPRLTVTPLGVFPRTKRLTVVGLFEIGAQADTVQAYVSLQTGQRLLGAADGVTGLQLQTVNLDDAPGIVVRLQQSLPDGLVALDWSQSQGSLFRAVKMEKIMVGVLLLSVVAVAAFNIVSTLVMSVAEKRRDIAVLRTMGARASGVMSIFVAHGLALALVGVCVGAVLGVMLALYIAPLTAFTESALGMKLFDPSVYFISELPSVLMWSDVLIIVIASLSLAFLATLYPAWRAARVAPAEVLRYE